MKNYGKVAGPLAPVFRVGLIGCGKMGMQHLKALAQVANIEIVAIADTEADEESVRPLLPPNARFLSDATSLLREVRPDVVHIVTPPDTHVSLAIAALSAGCHIYVEKPFAPTRAEAQEILSLASSRGLSVCAGHQCLFEPPALRSVELISRIGRMVHVESFFSFRKVRRAITDVEQCKDILPHAVYPLLHLLRAGTDETTSPIEIRGVDARSSGDLYALLRAGQRTGVLEVTLSGRPIEQYQHIIGSMGSLRADYVTESVTHLSGPGTGIGVLLTPYRRAFQTLKSATRTVLRLAFARRSSYSGLNLLIREFYASIENGLPSPTPMSAILDTVDVCERLGRDLDAAHEETEHSARDRLERQAEKLPPYSRREIVMVTGGTGFLGRPVAAELRHAGFQTRIVARNMPLTSRRVAGVDYAAADLAKDIPAGLFDNVTTIVHCAAETAGGMREHEQNSVVATCRLVQAAAAAGVRQIIHVSSLAVLVPGKRFGSLLDESSPIDAGNMVRGPYVWGKAKSEQDIQRLASAAGIELRIIRPGPLVDYTDFQPPGRLGRELGPWFLAIGNRKTPISVCDVGTAARVIRWYLESYNAAPPILNLVEGPAPTRGELVKRLLELRPDLRVRWIPSFIMRLANGPAKLAQRFLLGARKPIDIYSAFFSERYQTDLAVHVIARAGPSAIRT